jgi:hypothetical protein
MKFTPPISIEANSRARAKIKRTVPRFAPKNLSGSELKGGYTVHPPEKAPPGTKNEIISTTEDKKNVQ